MHNSVIWYVKDVVESFALSSMSTLEVLSTLEVGSYDVNGSIRSLFTGPYIGVDMRHGPGVDQVVNAHNLVETFGKDRFDVVVCCEMLEHDPEFWTSMREMGAVLAPGGILIATTRSIGFKLHGYPSDYWRFTPSAGRILAELAGLEDISVTTDPEASGIFFRGMKPHGR